MIRGAGVALVRARSRGNSPGHELDRRGFPGSPMAGCSDQERLRVGLAAILTVGR
jgi:hypothetical protein